MPPRWLKTWSQICDGLPSARDFFLCSTADFQTKRLRSLRRPGAQGGVDMGSYLFAGAMETRFHGGAGNA